MEEVFEISDLFASENVNTNCPWIFEYSMYPEEHNTRDLSDKLAFYTFQEH